MDVGVKDGKVVAVKGRATDRVNKGRLGPKGCVLQQTRKCNSALTCPNLQDVRLGQHAVGRPPHNSGAHCSESVKKRLPDSNNPFRR